MYFSFEKELSADATVTGNDKIIIKAVQASGPRLILEYTRQVVKSSRKMV